VTRLPPEFQPFFRRLRRHNRRPWYHAHKAEFLAYAKEPFDELVEALIHRIGTVEPAVRSLTPADCTFRLARDTRFSRDKTPYKLFLAAVVGPGGRKHLGAPAFYFQAGADGLAVGGGAYAPDKGGLLAIRRAIVRDGARLERLLAAAPFRHLYGELQGERNKRLPPEFANAVRRFPLVANKQFYYWAEYDDPAIVSRRDLVDLLMRHYRAGRPLNAWLADALRR
jgi:uncharacterized protein (TIGR02453 family)